MVPDTCGWLAGLTLLVFMFQSQNNLPSIALEVISLGSWEAMVLIFHLRLNHRLYRRVPILLSAINIQV
jgi:hypothetical protein